MNPRKPLSFIFFLVIVSLLVLTVVPAFFIRASESPKWFTAAMIISVILTILLSPTMIILGVLYKTDNPVYRVRNRIGMWGGVAIIVLLIAVIIYAQIYEGGGYAAPG